ncbi:asparaginyl-tRNA synthetase [Aspergillus melleus]|uniref:Asparaginyl-tRNA synthetase n=1 Tax=Aspergillus melleus TaxID=138277 RepID=A0ACC3AV84_9EURO|nr:asparaginyl-tRNA synthetase [Aspergillus melleus]
MLAQSDKNSTNLHQRWNMLLTPNWPRITFVDATRLLEPVRAAKGHHPPTTTSTQQDVTPDEETYLCEHFNAPVFLTHFPSQIRLSQAAQSAKDIAEIPPGNRIPSLPDNRIIRSSPPRHRRDLQQWSARTQTLDVLIDTMRKKCFLQGQTKGPVTERNAPADAKPYPYLHPSEGLKSVEWFADLRRWGTSPHGGFGVGFERLLQYLTGADTVKEVVSCPRYFGVCGC